MEVDGKWLGTFVINSDESKLLSFGRKQLLSFIQQVCSEPSTVLNAGIQQQRRLS